MSYNPFFSLKAENSNIASFSSTEEETYILLIANDIKTTNSDGTVNNNASKSNYISIGANVIDETTDEHELTINVNNNTNKNLIAKFNNNNILFNVDLLLDSNIIPNNSSQNIGSDDNKWGTIYTENIIADGANITNINLSDKSTDDLNETVNNRYYKRTYCRSRVSKIGDTNFCNGRH